MHEAVPREGAYHWYGRSVHLEELIARCFQPLL
jgi:hypothetical protein